MKTIGLTALSGAVDREKIENARDNLIKSGFRVKLSKNIFSRTRYLAGDDEERAEALCGFFRDPDVDIIMASRGGYGAIRLINKIDYSIIKDNPKIFSGYSDITALLLMIYRKTGMVTYHGLMACSDFGTKYDFEEEGCDRFSFEHFISAVNGERLEFEGEKIYLEGKTQGIIWGGNLSTVVSLCGQDFIPDDDFIFFTEDLNEPVYKIDRMFTQLFNIDKFREKCKGIVLGEFMDTDRKDWLEEFFNEFSVPAAGGFKITHSGEKITIPVGKKAELDGLKLTIG